MWRAETLASPADSLPAYFRGPHQRISRSPARSQASPAGSVPLHQRRRAENGRHTQIAIRFRFRLDDILLLMTVCGWRKCSQLSCAWLIPTTAIR
jgi:hypothetical protein